MLCCTNMAPAPIGPTFFYRVDELQGTLASLTGLRAGEQIVMCDGRPLDPGQLLSAYKLPVVRNCLTVLYLLV